MIQVCSNFDRVWVVVTNTRPDESGFGLLAQAQASTTRNPSIYTLHPKPYGLLHRVSSSRLGPVDPSLRALSGRLNFTVRCHKSSTDSRYGLSADHLACPARH